MISPAKRLLTVITFLFLFQNFSKAQNRSEDFELPLPGQKVQNSFYNKIQFLDSRFDTTHMGIVQLGAFNKKARVIPKIHFAAQLGNVLNALIDSSAKEGALLFQLRQLSFAEITGATSERGYFYFKAALYMNKEGGFRRLSSVDTLILIKSMDVTKALFRNGSKSIIDFITGNLQKTPADTNIYSFTDVVNIDSIEKRNITLYNTSEFKDGLYNTYQAFYSQLPDQQVQVESKGDKIISVKATGDHGKPVKIKSNDVYALVHNGQPFISTDFGYYPLQKVNDDFYFTGKAKVNANSGDVIVASMFFGIIGGLIASDAEATFEMKLDHTNGGFIRLREVAADTQQ